MTGAAAGIQRRAGSLRWRLARSLIPLQLAIAVALLLALFVALWASGRLTDESGRGTTETILRAIDLRAGKIALAPTPEFQRLLDGNPRLWFEVRDATGGALSHGQMPPEYGGLIDTLGTASRVLIDGSGGNDGTAKARLERFDTPHGPVRIFAGTGSILSWRAAATGWWLLFLYLIAPMALVSSLVLMVAMPGAIRRGLSRGLGDAAKRIERVNVHEPHEPLRVADSISELQPFFKAVNDSFDRLAEGYRQQQRFLGEAAHELRTPIAILQARLEALPPGPLKGPLLTDVARLANLAEQLLDLQRLRHSGAMMAALSLKRLSEDVVADLAPLAVLRGSSLAIEAADIGPMKGDLPALSRALTNLIQNALEHAGPGCAVLVCIPRRGVIEVHDSGAGIPEEERDRVMAPFHRLGTRSRGAGLGLHLVNEVARLHDGRLTITTSPKGGACMRLELNG